MTDTERAPMTAEEFARLTPRQRGYVVYCCGSRADWPHVPDEHNPYPRGSYEATEWDEGQSLGAQAAMDAEDD